MDERAQNVAHVAAQWLTWLFGERPPGLIWIGGHGNWTGCTFETPAAAAEYAAKMDAAQAGTEGGVYFRLTPMRPAARGDRGGAEHSTHLVAFGADLDLAGPGHKPTKLPRPETEEQLREILAAAGVPEPSAWVHSGGGRYAFWKLADPLPLMPSDGLADLAMVTSLTEVQAASATLHARIIAAAAERGWKIDNTRDLARVYRLPGTHNRKGVADGGQGHQVRAALPKAWEGNALYTLADFPGTTPERSDTPEVSEGVRAPSPAQTQSQLFSGGAEDIRPRRLSVSYTLADAMTFVGAALDRLRAARDGEINNRLNDAAMAMAHFGPEFWDRAAAERQLYAALDATVYDGATWQAADTIRSAYDATAARGAAGDEECWAARLNVKWTAAPAAAVAQEAARSALDKVRARLLDRDQIDEMPEPEPLILGMLDLDSESWIIGPSGDFKSFVALDMACHVATDLAWRGKLTRHGDVLYVAAEGGKGVPKRIRAWEKTYGRRASRVHLLPMPLRFWTGDRKNPVSDEWRALVTIATEMRPVMIVIDTQARVTAGMNENDNGEMSLFAGGVGMLKDAAGSCVLVVHHTGRNGGDARGASAIDAAQDAELKVERPKNEVKRKELTTKIHLDKQKDEADGTFIEVKLKVVEVGTSRHTGKPITSLAILPVDEWAPAEYDPAAAPNWRLHLDGVAAEVMTVMEDHASGETGALFSEISKWILERRRESDEKAKPPAASTLSTAIKRLCAERVSGVTEPGPQLLSRIGTSRVVLISALE